MSPTVEKILIDVCQNARLSIEQVLDELRSEAAEQAAERQKMNDVRVAVRSYLELKQDDASIFRLLKKYYDIDSITEASEIISKAKFSAQIINLRLYCEENGMPAGTFRQWAKDNQLEEKLKSNSKLLDMSPEKLKANIENKRN